MRVGNYVMDAQELSEESLNDIYDEIANEIDRRDEIKQLIAEINEKLKMLSKLSRAYDTYDIINDFTGEVMLQDIQKSLTEFTTLENPYASLQLSYDHRNWAI